MKLDCVLTAVNENSLYLDFVPIFIKTWNKLYPTVAIKIILIAKQIPKKLLCYKDKLILFEPIKDVSTAFTSQFIRLLYPCILDYINGVMITDIDNLPMNKTFFTKNIETISNDKWINLRDWCTHNEICMMWQVSTPKIWKEVFNINNLEDIKKTLIKVYTSINYIDGYGNSGWSTDQLYLYTKVMAWNNKTHNYVVLKDKNTHFLRLNRSHKFNINKIKKNISNGVYSDYHCYRPMSKYSDINYKIYDLL